MKASELNCWANDTADTVVLWGDIRREIMRRTGMRTDTVDVVVRAFAEVVVEILAQGKSAHVQGFGKFTPFTYFLPDGRRFVRIGFSQSRPVLLALRKALLGG